jgi:hypothetical protein
MSTQAELFTKDLENFHTGQKHYLDASGNFIGYDPKGFIRPLYIAEDKKVFFDNKTLFRGYGVVKDPTCTMDDPTLKGSEAGGLCIGLSNFNFGHITKPEEFGGTMIEALGWSNQEIKQTIKVDLDVKDAKAARSLNHKEFLVKGELTAPLVEAQDEQGWDEETQWHCKGCSKYFATKASLKRHHERKKSCKELSEKPQSTSTFLVETPYIIDWVDQLVSSVVSGALANNYCKHCEVEFANKANLHKHLSKSVACDKLAKQEFIKIFTSN